MSKSMCGFFRRNCLGLQNFFLWFNIHWFLQPKVVGTYLPDTGTLGWGTRVGLGLLAPEIFLLIFIHHTHKCGTSPFCISAPPTSLGGYGFSNSVAVRLPFSLHSWSYLILFCSDTCSFLSLSIYTILANHLNLSFEVLGPSVLFPAEQRAYSLLA